MVIKMEDLRKTRTLKLLKEALLEMMTKKSFEEIKINDICNVAMVHRTTFYSHFDDKYDLLEYCIKEAEKEITEKMEPENYTSIQEFYTNMIMALVCYIEGNKEKFKAMLIKNDNTSFYKMFNSTCVLYIYKMLQKEEKSGVKHEVPINLVAEFYAGAVISSVTYWIKDSSGMTSQELCDHLIKLIFGQSYIK